MVGLETNQKLQNALRTLTVLTVVLFLLLGGAAGWFIKNNSDRAAEGQRAHNAICLLKHDLELRVAAGQAYLDSHPGDILGIPRAQVQQSIDNQKATIAALSVAKCRG